LKPRPSSYSSGVSNGAISEKGHISMKTVRVAALFCVVLAGLVTSARATTGTCESLPGGPIELESTGGAIGPTGYATLGAALTDINNGSYTGTITIDVCG